MLCKSKLDAKSHLLVDEIELRNFDEIKSSISIISSIKTPGFYPDVVGLILEKSNCAYKISLENRFKYVEESELSFYKSELLDISKSRVINYCNEEYMAYSLIGCFEKSSNFEVVLQYLTLLSRNE